MTDLAALKSYLIEKGGLRPEQIAQAEDYALTRNISLEEALVFLELIDYSVLGKRLADLYGRPYVALLDKEPQKTAKARVSLKMAAKLRVFPVKYDSEKNVLALAVSNPKDSGLAEKLKTLFHGTTRLAFCVASAAEIEKAIDVYYRGMSYSMSQEIHLPKDFTIIADASCRRLRGRDLDPVRTGTGNRSGQGRFSPPPGERPGLPAQRSLVGSPRKGNCASQDLLLPPGAHADGAGVSLP
ncbi:MAG: hypothetical protein MUC98_08415 [Desulfobacterota bacterium]|nr:hypothetical protein [Thermodesulfobacteriota bacterium]